MAQATSGLRKIRLTDRDRAVLEHVWRYRISTIEVLHRLFWEPSTTLNAVSQVLARLEGYLHTAPLVGPRRYYLLTPRAAREFNEDEDFARPLGPSSLARHYAMLSFCCLEDVSRERITPREWRNGFPRFDRRGLARHGYFHTSEDPPKLGWLEVDCGGDASRRVRKCSEQYRKRAEVDAFRALVDRDQFALALVTTSGEKRRAIERALRKIDIFPMSIHVNETMRDIIVREVPDAGASGHEGVAGAKGDGP